MKNGYGKRILNNCVFFLAANIDEAMLHTLSRDDLRDLFPGPEHFLRRKRVWALISPEVSVTYFVLEHPSMQDISSSFIIIIIFCNFVNCHLPDKAGPPVSPKESTPLKKKKPKEDPTASQSSRICCLYRHRVRANS